MDQKPSNISVLSLLAVIALSFALILVEGAEVLTKPNIIFIMMDDVGVYDTANDIPMPFYNFLEDSGVKLTNYYVNALCTPSRAAFMTGRYAVNVGLTSVLVPGLFLLFHKQSYYMIIWH